MDPMDGGAPAETGQPEVTNETGNANSHQDGGATGDNPAWGELLGALPGGLHGIVKPHLARWDQGVQQRFQQVQSQYAPYKQFLDGGISAEEIQQARNLMQLVATQPRQFYDRMTEYYKDEWGLGVSDQGREDGNEWEDDPDEFDQDNPLAQQLADAQSQIEAMRGNQDTMAQYLAGQVEQRVQNEANAEVEREFNEVSQKYGDLNPQQVNFIVSQALQNGTTVMQAADSFFSMIGSQPKQQVPAPPRVVSTSGGTPQSPPINPGNLSGKDRRALVQSILAQNFDPQ